MPVLFLYMRGVWSTVVAFHAGGEVGCGNLRHVTHHIQVVVIAQNIVVRGHPMTFHGELVGLV